MRQAFDFHTHSALCDGTGELEEYVESALAKGLGAVGLSAHAPCSIASAWHMKAADLPGYLSRGRLLARQYSGRIEVLVGLEADYVPGVSSPRETRRAFELDYVIGSVHYLGQLSDGTPWTVDGSVQELERGVRESYGGDARRALARYFELVAVMAREEAPDIVGHLDLVKKLNRGLFDEEASWYHEIVEGALRGIREAGCVVEINTGAVSRGYRGDFYPADRFVSLMARAGIPVTLGSDAHRPEHVAAHFDRALDSLARGGYRECWRRTASGWTSVALDAIR